MKFWTTNGYWVFATETKTEHTNLIAICKHLAGKSHGLVSVWYSSGERAPQSLRPSHNPVVVKNRDLALQIILTFTPECLD